MKKLYLLFTVIFIFSACHNNDEPTPVAEDTRTVLAYMGGDYLTSDLNQNIADMVQGYSEVSDGNNFLIYMDDGVTPTLYRLEKNSSGVIEKKIIKTYSNQISVDPAVINQVFSDAFSVYPAQSYGAIFSSHGTGWIPATKKVQAKSFGSDNGYQIDIVDMASVMENITSKFKRLDFLLFDACYMGEVEVAYEFRDCANYIIAAPNEIWSTGFPYKLIVKYLFDSQANFQKIPAQFFDYYNLTYDDHRLNSTIAMIKCSEMENLATATRKIIAAHPSEFYTIVPSGIQLYDRFGSSEHFTYDFGQLIESIATPAEWISFKNQLNATVVYKAATNFTETYLPFDKENSGAELQIDPNHFSGLGTYIPKASQITYINFFKTLSWFDASGWNQTAWGTN